MGRWRMFRLIVSGVLLTAAAVKAFMVTEILASDGLLSSLPVLLTVIGYEAGLAVYIQVVPQRRAWLAVTITFSIFSAVAALSLVTHSNCNCFGGGVGSHITLPVDLCILGGCWYFRFVRHSVKSAPLPRHLLLMVAPAVVAVVFAGLGYHGHQAQFANSDLSLDFLLAEMLTGKPWPLGQTQHPLLEEMHDGGWLVLIVRRDCEHCRELVEREFAQADRRGPFERTAVFVAGSKEWAFQFDRISIDVDSQNVISWAFEEPFVASPAIFCLSDGVVTSAADGAHADTFMEEFFSATADSSQ